VGIAPQHREGILAAVLRRGEDAQEVFADHTASIGINGRLRSRFGQLQDYSFEKVTAGRPAAVFLLREVGRPMVVTCR
jgi:hypothetical protein